MTAEWLLGIVVTLVAAVKAMFLYIWFKHEKQLSAVSTNQVKLERVLMANYLDKHETQRYVDRELASVQHSIDRLADVIVPLTSELKKLNDKVLVLETKEQYNVRTTGSP